MNTIFDGEHIVEYWLSIMGRALFSNDLEEFYILTGRGGNGKSLLFDFLKNCIGDYFNQHQAHS